MKLFRSLLSTLIGIISFINPILSETLSPIPTVNNFPISPDFALQLIQSNLNLVQITFDNPENSFSVITDPLERLNFLQGISSSLFDLTSSLSFLNQQIPFGTDNSFISLLNSEISQINEGISQRVSQYLLPLNVSQIEINPNFIISRFNQSEINTFYQENEEIFIQIPSIIQPLNQSLYDLSVQILDGIQSFPSEDILASINSLQLKLNDINGFSFPTQAEIIFTINEKICDFVDNCDLYCGLLDKNQQVWLKYPIQVYNLHQIKCKVPIQTITTNDNSRSLSYYSTLAVFQGELGGGGNSELSTPFIVFISFAGALLIVMFVYGYKRYLNQKKTGIIREQNKGYQSII